MEAGIPFGNSETTENLKRATDKRLKAGGSGKPDCKLLQAVSWRIPENS